MKQLKRLYEELDDNKSMVVELIEEIDDKIKEISELVYVGRDPETKRKFNEALKHIRLGFQIIEDINV